LYFQSGVNWLQGISTYDGNCLNFQYWPGFSAFMAIFQMIPYWVGCLLWTGINEGLLLYAAWRFANEFIPDSHRNVGLFFLLILPMSIEGLLNQQCNPLLVSLILFSAVQIANGKWWTGSLLMLIPALTKIAPICFPLLYMVIFPRQLWWRILLCLAILLVLPFLFQEAWYVRQEYADWWDRLCHEAGARWAYRDAWMLWELIRTGTITQFTVGKGSELYLLIQLAMAGVAFISCLRQRFWRGMTDHFSVVYATCAGMAWWLVFGPSTELATCVCMAPALAWGSLHSRISDCGFKLMLTAFIFTALGSNGDVEVYLYNLTESNWPKALLPTGGLLFIVWWLIYGGCSGSDCNRLERKCGLTK